MMKFLSESEAVEKMTNTMYRNHVPNKADRNTQHVLTHNAKLVAVYHIITCVDICRVLVLWQGTCTCVIVHKGTTHVSVPHKVYTMYVSYLAD